MAITANRLPWRHDINVFMTPISHTNWNTNTVSSSFIRNGYKESNGTQNAEISFDVTLARGTWTIELLHYKSPTQGIYHVKIDDVQVGTIDAYADPATYNQRSTVTGVFVATSGKKRLKLKMETKNVSSSQYYGIISHIQLRRTA